MNDIHDMLRRHRISPRRPLSATFTNDIITKIDATPRRQSFAARLLAPIPEVYMRLLQLPKVALVTLAIVAAGTGTAAAYGAYNWLIPKISILGITAHNDDNKREFAVNVENCGVMVGGETANNGSQRYEVSPDAHLTDEQVVKVLKTSCDYQQVLQLMNNHWHDQTTIGKNAGDITIMTMPGAGGDNVINDPSIGTIAALDDSHITINSKVYSHFNGPSVILPGEPVPDYAALTDYYPKGKTLSRTLELKPDADVMANGQAVPRSQLKVGDTVFFMSEVTRTVQPGRMGDITSIRVAHIIQTDIDPAYVQPMWVGDPNIVNAIARLDTCQGNNGYLCIAAKSMQLQFKTAYSYTPDSEASPTPDKRFTGNEKYLRTDINMNSKDGGKYYHAIEGRITGIDGTKLTLQSRGKVQKFSVTLPYDIVTQFNQTQKQHMQAGDYIQVNYLQKDGEDRTNIKVSDIYGISLLMRQLADGSLAKY